jgi:hypothetical protein
VPGVVVMVTPFEPTSVSVSGAASATTSDCPATAIVPNACVPAAAPRSFHAAAPSAGLEQTNTLLPLVLIHSEPRT